MPQAAVAAFAAIGSAITAGATAVSATIGGLAALAGGVAFGGLVADATFAILGGGTLLGALSTVSVVASLGARSPKIGAGGSPVSFKADPNAGFPYVMGITATGGNIVFAQTALEKNNRWLHYIVALSACGPIQSIDSFSANEQTIAFAGSPGYAATTSPFSGGPVMWQSTTLGTRPGTMLPNPTGQGTVPEWTSSHFASSVAAARWVLGYASDKYPTGVPKPLWFVHGVKVYDPRLDSTYPGGSGSHRSNDETTWAFSENPALHGLAWTIGREVNGVRILGIGAPIASIDVAAFVDGANICDANGWKLGGVVSSKDSKWEVLLAMLQAGGMLPIKLSAKISCVVNTPRTSIATLASADLNGPAGRARETSRRDKVNQVVPSFRSADHNYEMIAAAPVQVVGYVSAEGLLSKGIEYPLVQNVTQASQLALYACYDTHEAAPITLPVRLRWRNLKPGDVITANIPELGLSSQDLLIIDRKTNPSTLDTTLICRFETATKHTNALALTGDIPFVPTPRIIDPRVVPAPEVGVWTAVAASVSAGGLTRPVIRITRVDASVDLDNTAATDIVVDYEAGDFSGGGGTFVGSGVIASYGNFPIGTPQVDIDTIAPGVPYQPYISYIVRGVQGARLALPVVTSGAFSSPGGTPTTGGDVGGGITGTVIYDNSTPGAFSFTSTYTGSIVIEDYGPGGSIGTPYTSSTPGDFGPTFEIVFGEGGPGGKAVKTISATSGVTVVAGTISSSGSATTVTSPAMTANSGGPGSADAFGSYTGSSGTASGGDTNTTGGGSSGMAPGRIRIIAI